jgi:hypothetical protein
MCQQRVERIKKIILDRLPQDHRKPIKTYKTMQGMIMALSKHWNIPYNRLIALYKARTYISIRDYNLSSSKDKKEYYQFQYKETKPINQDKWFFVNIIAVAHNPIRVCCEMLDGQTDVFIAGTILHELGHLYKTSVDKPNSEEYAEEYAIRWIRKFIKEGLICERD